MAITYQNILPDPNNPIGPSGQNSGIVNGPGYKSVSLTSEAPIMRTRTNSGRMVTRAVAGHKWKIKIGYNPLIRTEFEPIYNFLLNRRGGLKPFYVSLPQYRIPQNSNFADYAEDNAGNIKVVASSPATVAAGASSMTITVAAGEGDPAPGDLFTITDASDINHVKTYRITQVENNSIYDSVQPTTAQRIIHFIPPLQKLTNHNATVKFHNPLIRVILSSDVQEYSLSTNGLYSFSLALEEALP